VEPRVLPPSTLELNLLLEWPVQRTPAQWAAIFGASVLIHVAIFLFVTTMPGLIGEGRRPEPRVIVHHIPLYLPRDVMTQREPNRQKPSKQIDLADLTPSRAAMPSPGSRRTERHFEVPKQLPQIAKKTQPAILAPAPTIDLSKNGSPSSGSPSGLPVAAPPPPSAPPSPFQDIGDAGPSNPHPTLAPPKANVESPINGLTQDTNSPQLSISDDSPERARPGTPGAMDQAAAQHSAVELESDPNGVDFKNYLRQILTIVRANWRQVLPESARMGTLRGRTVIEFIINRDGSIPKMVTADSSGSGALDRAAVAGLSMSNPLPPLPDGYRGFQVRLAFTFAYNMPSK
jgi:periplasmic protein TonB